MKKQTQKKSTEKLKKAKSVAGNEEREFLRKNNNYGITLIALVITVIVLLILAGISISMLSGDNSILSRATQARTKTGNAQDEETISLAYLAAVTGNYTNGEDISATLTSELEKTYGSGKVTVTKNETNNSYEVAITGKGTYTIDANGKVEKQGPAVTYANERIVTSSDGTGENVAAGTKTPTTDKLYIYFEVSVEGGTTSISPSVPFKITENGTYNFTITSTVNGENFTTTHSVIANQYAARAGIKVGDYISYTSPTKRVELSEDETGYIINEQTLFAKNMFRVMDIASDGSMTLIGAMESGDDTIYCQGAKGYNNAVYILNKKCSDLYKDTLKGITARSIKIEDITDRLTSTETDAISSYISTQVGNLSTGTYISAVDSTNKKATYVNSKSYYPNLFKYESGGLIGTTETTGSVERSVSYNGYGSDGILTSEDKDGDNNVIPQSSQVSGIGTLTLPYTYFSSSYDADDFEYETEALRTAYNSMFFGTGTSYWLASRCIYCGPENACFCLHRVNGSSLNAYSLYNSDASPMQYCCRVCPVVSIPSSVQVTASTDNSEYHQSSPHIVVTTN